MPRQHSCRAMCKISWWFLYYNLDKNRTNFQQNWMTMEKSSVKCPPPRSAVYNPYIDGFVQERRNSIANALELRLSCTKPSIFASSPSHIFKVTVPTITVWVRLVTKIHSSSDHNFGKSPRINPLKIYPWWHHDLETISALLVFCEGSLCVNVGFHSQRDSNAELWCFLCCC